MNRKLVWLILPVMMVAAVVAAILLTDSSEPVAQAVLEPAPRESGFMTDTVTDEQGAVTVAVTPLNLNEPGETLDFEVVLDTHSVDLGMDLAERATLNTDAGLAVVPSAWEAPSGGHHVAGTLSFPAISDGKSTLEGAREVTLLIRDVDAGERHFSWMMVSSPAG